MTVAVTMLPTLDWMRVVAVSRAVLSWSAPMLRGGPAAQSRRRWMPLPTPVASSPAWEATGTAMRTRVPAAMSRNRAVTAEAAKVGCQPCWRRKRVTGQVKVVSSRAMTRGQMIDHIWPRIHRVTAAISTTSSICTEIRAEVRSAARVFVTFSGADTRSP